MVLNVKETVSHLTHRETCNLYQSRHFQNSIIDQVNEENSLIFPLWVSHNLLNLIFHFPYHTSVLV